MDKFTAGILLSAAMNGGGDEVADLYKSLNDGAPKKIDQTMQEKVASLIGRRCRIKYTPYVGTIKGFNEALGGFYGGERFPYLVCIDEVQGGKKNVTFEYSEDQVELID